MLYAKKLKEEKPPVLDRLKAWHEKSDEGGQAISAVFCALAVIFLLIGTADQLFGAVSISPGFIISGITFVLSFGAYKLGVHFKNN